MCPACRAGLSEWECLRPTGVLCKLIVPTTEEVIEVERTKTDKRTRRHKEDDEVLDAKSTGRKRAAQLIKLKDEEGNRVVCSWAGLKFAGGGEYPIVGCANRLATNRHHGPNKDTLENTPGINLHGICSHCHNRWHTLNDPNYAGYIQLVGGVKKVRPHDGKTRASDEEIIENEKKWILKK